MENRQFHCQFNGCGRSFARKEHLTRHEKSHISSNLHTCHVCHRKFNRSDSLLRHLAKHGNVFKPNPSGRSKRACITCHAGKIKCDGNEKCSTCLKRKIECKYRVQDEHQISISPTGQEDQPNGQVSTSPGPSPEEQEQSMNVKEPLENNAQSQIGPLGTQIGQLISNGISEQLHLKRPSTFQAPSAQGLVDWSSVKFIRDSNSQDAALDHNLEDQSNAESEKYMSLYYLHFHHRWPILHRPSLEEEAPIGIVISSMKMIGAWLDGTLEARKYALDTHEELVKDILSQLSKVTSKDKFQQSLSACLCQAALLNIIFGLYSGRESVLSRVLILRNVLVSVLRDVGFFDPDSVWVDEKPGYFLPLKLVKINQRSMMAAYLFRIDTYLSMVRHQPALLMPEELHYGLQQIYSLWNCDGLPLWESRQSNEPLFRSDKSLYDMINESASNSVIFKEYPILIEDIQQYICAIQPSIWKVSSRGDYSSDCEISTILQKDTLRRRLDTLKDKLDQIVNQKTDNVEFGQELCLPYRYYFGYEEPSQPGWQNCVMKRVNDLLFDTLMLYNLFSLQLYAEIGTLNRLAKDQSLDPVREASQRHGHAREQRQLYIGRWVETPTARQALCHAVVILHAHQNMSESLQESRDNGRFTLDPMAYTALALGALVVWAYSSFNKLGCEACFLGSRMNAFHAVDLANWTVSSPALEKEKETWIEMGAAFPVQLHGIELCKCNADLLTNLFRIYLPPGWELANAIAPGLFTQKEQSGSL